MAHSTYLLPPGNGILISHLIHKGRMFHDLTRSLISPVRRVKVVIG